MALKLPKFNLPKLSIPKFGKPKPGAATTAQPAPASNKKRLPLIVGGVVVLAAAGWFGWQYFMEEPAPPPPPPKPVAKHVAPTAPSPAEAAKTRDTLVDDVLAATGLKQELNQLPERLLAGARQSAMQQKKGSATVTKAIEDAMAKSFTGEAFQGRVSADLKKNFDQKRMQALLKEFSAPVAKHMIQLEGAAHSPQDLAHFAKSAAATKPAPGRAALIKRIDAATRASDLAVEFAFVSMKALAAGVAGDDAKKAAAVDKTIEKQRASAEKDIREATLASIAFSFKDASDADLEKYAGIYEAQDSKWFYNQVYASLLEAAKTASAAAADDIHAASAKPAGAASKTAHAKTGKSGGDARDCLKLATNREIMNCAEAYR